MKKYLLILGLLISVFAQSQSKITVKVSGGGGANLTSIGVYTPESYGAVGNGTTDDSEALQDCIDAAPAGSVIQLSKIYYIPTALSITKELTIKGNNHENHGFTTDGNNVILLIEWVYVTVQNVKFVATGTRTAGSAIHATHDGPAQAYMTTIKDCYFKGFYDGIKHDASFHLTVSGCTFFEQWHRDMVINNLLDSDIGDQHIFGNYFNGGIAHVPPTCIEYESGGGMNLVGNKFNWSGATGVRYNYLIAAQLNATNDFISNSNSYENYNISAIVIIANPAFGNITISGDQFAAYVSASTDIYIEGAKTVSIQGNVHSASGVTAITLVECEDAVLSNAYAASYTTPVVLTDCTNVQDLNGVLP